MANFKGGFAFNNEAAKVEVEQAPDGTLISCVNPVTGESLGGGNSKEVITGTASTIFSNMGYDAAIALALDISYMNALINASILYDLDATAIVGQHLTGQIMSANIPSNNMAVFKTSEINNDNTVGVSVIWDVTENNSSFKASQFMSGSWTDVSAVFGALPITLTIYHHPMP